MRKHALTPIQVVDTLASVRGADGSVLATLLRLGSIRIDDRTATASVSCTDPPVLRINPEFVRTHASTPERLHALVLHEVLHVMLGHTRRGPTVSVEDNLVYDAVINAAICRLHPDSAFTSLFTDLYSESTFPECLLRPASGWHPTDAADEVPVPPALEDPSLQRAAGIYRRLYSIGCTESELRELVRSLGGAAASFGLGRLLGDHSRVERVRVGDRSVMATILRDLAEASKTADREDDGRGRGAGGPLVEWTDERIREQRRRSFNEIRALIREIGECDDRLGSTVTAPRLVPIDIQGPAARLDRRGLVAKALGMPWLLGTNSIDQLRKAPVTVDVHMYLDVSCSMHHVLPIVANAILSCRRELRPVIHQFSTEVTSLAMADLAAGRLRTTGGTDINCVASHILRHSVERAVIVTDGFVGRTHGHDEHRAMCRARLGIVVTPGGTAGDFAGIANKVCTMPEVGDRS